MTKRPRDLTFEELEKAGREAAEAARAEAWAAGLAVTGLELHPDGRYWLARQRPDRRFEWIRPAVSEFGGAESPEVREVRSGPASSRAFKGRRTGACLKQTEHGNDFESLLSPRL